MADQMLQFVRVSQAQPEKRAVEERSEDFDEIYRKFAQDSAAVQSSRCSQCGVPFCSIHCPLNNNIPDWLMLTAEGRFEEAYEISVGDQQLPGNLWPHLSRRIACAKAIASSKRASEIRHDRLGREIHHRHGPGNAAGSSRSTPKRELGHSVGIIGAGPGWPRRRRWKLRGQGLHRSMSTTATIASAA